VLRAHAVAAGLDPAFAVLDDAAGRELREAAFEAAVAGLLGAPEAPPRADALDLAAAYGLDRLKRAILDVHGQLRSAGQERPALPPPPAAPDASALRAELGVAREAALACLEGVEGTTVDRARRAIEQAGALVGDGAAPSLGALGAAGFKAGNTGLLKSEPCARYLEALAALAGAYEEAEGARGLALLDELLGRYADAYAVAKRGRSAVDFDDLELMVAGLFDRLPGLAAAWAQRFDRIMVDEFQDTNALQVALLERLDAGHTFRVGDELQSIYGFRHASVEVFRATRRALQAGGGVARLSQNFRTRAEVLAQINAASARLHEAFEPLVPGRETASTEAPLVEILLTDARNGSWDDEDLGRLPGGPAWRWAEARLLAQRIAELVEGGTPAGEIVVLVRAATDIACYERAIEDHGISTLASGGRGFWARQQVQDLTQYLATLANPRDEPALLGVLASPLGPRLGSDALALLALAARRGGRGLWAAIEDSGWEAALPADDAQRLLAWRERFAAERARAPRLSLADLLSRAIAASRYDEHVLRLPGGLRRLANVRKLVRLAGAYERDVGRGVRGFIDRATAELEAEAREADAPVELAGFDAVRLMTIHAAKGLEFGVVAVADLGRPPNTQLPDLLVDGGRVGLRVVTLHGKAKTDAYEALAAERERAEREELLRIFHVALTRAQERLILSGALNVEKWSPSTPAGWLLPAFVPNLGARLLEEGPVIEEAGVRATLSAPGNGVLAAHRPVAPRRGAARLPPPARSTYATPSPPTLPPPVAALSYSALSRYAQCGYRFYLERVLRLPEQEAPPGDGAAAPGGLDPLVRGSIAHELLEALDLAAPAVPGEGAIRAQAARHDVELGDEDLADLRALLEGAIGSEVMQRVAHAAERHVEEAFALALTAPEHAHVPLFSGFIDLRAVEADGGALIVDYKTDRLDGADPERVVAAGYGIQRRLYALAALRAGAPSVEVAHLFLERPGHPAVARYEAADVARLEDELAADAAGVLSGRFAVADHPHRELCATCPGRGGLCSWPEAVTLQPLSES
jgi:ATP-dependent exoDNAse (exonuclease V) beta subunit